MRSWFALLLVLLMVPRVARAHVRSVSWSTWNVVGATVEVRVRMSTLDLSALGGAGTAGTAGEADEALRALDLEPCTREGSGQAAAEPGFVVRTLRFRCPEGATLRVKSDLFLDRLPSHLHFAQLSRDGVVVAEQMLSRERRTWELPLARSGLRLAEMVRLGVHHILSGADHLVFLLTLFVAATSFRALFAVVTGFTLGHTAALTLAVLLGVRPDANAIEALVGATIAIVAVENVWLARKDKWLPRALLVGLAATAWVLRPEVALGLALFVACSFGLIARTPRPSALGGSLGAQWPRLSMTALFGLIHGFAFSSVLTEMVLPRGRLASALFGFNLGVEVGQVAILALFWPIFRFIARTRWRHAALDLSSAAALGAGVFWLLSRAA